MLDCCFGFVPYLPSLQVSLLDITIIELHLFCLCILQFWAQFLVLAHLHDKKRPVKGAVTPVDRPYLQTETIAHMPGTNSYKNICIFKNAFCSFKDILNLYPPLFFFLLPLLFLAVLYLSAHPSHCYSSLSPCSPLGLSTPCHQTQCVHLKCRCDLWFSVYMRTALCGCDFVSWRDSIATPNVSLFFWD